MGCTLALFKANHFSKDGGGMKIQPGIPQIIREERLDLGIFTVLESMDS